MLVYFADWRSETPLKSLNAALGRVVGNRLRLALWRSSFFPQAHSTRPPEKSSRRLGSNREPPMPVHFTRDDVFAVGKKPFRLSNQR